MNVMIGLPTMVMKKTFDSNRYIQKRVPQFLLFVSKNFRRCHLSLIATSLTFTTLLALVPFFTVTVIMVNAFPMFAGMATQFNQFLTNIILPAAGADSVGNYLDAFRAKASGLTAVGIVSMFITSLMLIQTIEQAFNQIWKARDKRPLWIRMLIYWAFLTLGPVVMGMSLSFLSILTHLGTAATHIPFTSNLFSYFINLALITTLLFLLYKLVPFCFVPWRHALLSAILVAVALDLLRRGFALFIIYFGNYQLVYGAFAAIPVFLIWLNLLWLLLLTGAVLTSSLPYWHRQTFRQLDQHQLFEDALNLLLKLLQAQQVGKAISAYTLQQQLQISDKHLSRLLNDLEDHRYITHNSYGWVLQLSAEKIMLNDLFRLYVYNDVGTSEVAKSIHSMLSPCLPALNINLSAWAKKIALDTSTKQQK